MGDEQLGFDIPGEGELKPKPASKAKAKASDKGSAQAEPENPSGPRKLQDDEVFDYITGDKVVKLTEAEKVRQRIARALVRQYAIDPDDMVADFPIPVVNAKNGRKSRRRASIAIFEHGQPKELQYIRRIVVTKPRPNDSRTVSKIRTFAHAKEQVDEVADLMHAAGRDCVFGLWTDDKDLYFIRRDHSRFEDEYRAMANWPRGDATLFDAQGNASSLATMRRADETMLRFAFRRCHNYIHGNEGLPKDAAFWQFLYVLFAKLYDERLVREKGREPRFYVDSDDLAEAAKNDMGSPAVAARITELFAEVKEVYAKEKLFNEYDRLTLGPAALTFITSELYTYSIHDTSLDALGTAYQELVGDNLRGDRGQYFTPNGAVRLMVEMLDPDLDQTVFDPCCGTGGFLRESLLHVLHKKWMPKDEKSLSVQERARFETKRRGDLAAYAKDRIYGADFDPFLTRAAAFGVMMLTDIAGNTFQMDSLGFPRMGNLPGVEPAMKHLHRIAPGEVDVLLTNPPFGTDIPVTGPVLDLFREEESGEEKQKSIAYGWSREEDGTLKRGKPATSVAPERLFVQKAVEWVKPGGRIGIVLPNGILSNPGPDDEAVRQYILDECWVMASVELPVEIFVVGAGVNILTTLLFLRKKTEQEKFEERLHGELDYPVFMAVAEKVGFDRRGNPLHVRNARGDRVVQEYEETDEIVVKNVLVERRIKRRDFIIDNDLMSLRDRTERHNRPSVITEYHAFLERHGHELPWKKGERA
ncbi:methylation-associated defense system DNA methyltransferase MAD2 [Streptomyces decoyicus]|uniref:methylation-associated defense system DNA methyltransferase MAD2 n=1 Tax=Streptomyces decoyicus TaxID=249567 RepID=UPI0033B035EB